MPINSSISLLSATVGLFAVVLARLLWILPSIRAQSPPSRKSAAKLVIVLGSGGHTAEMLRLIEPLDFGKYTRRQYVISSGDALSEGKARAFEKGKNTSDSASVLSYFRGLMAVFRRCACPKSQTCRTIMAHIAIHVNPESFWES